MAKIIIFDLDGTLYELEGGSFPQSKLKKKIAEQAKSFVISKLSKNQVEAEAVLKNIQTQYGDDISLGLEKEFSLDRYEYFNFVWNIPALGIVKKSQKLRDILNNLSQDYRLVLVSDAPQIWIDNVLRELNIKEMFIGYIFSGEGTFRKDFNNAFDNILTQLKVHSDNCISIGDQEETDIIPAKKLGMKTIFVNPARCSTQADISIKSINDLSAALEQIV